jgi:hypothetical protein
LRIGPAFGNLTMTKKRLAVLLCATVALLSLSVVEAADVLRALYL